jgi:hypothetical protein
MPSLRMKCPVAGVSMGEGMAMAQMNAEPPDPRHSHITTVLPLEAFEFKAGKIYTVTIEEEGT